MRERHRVTQVERFLLEESEWEKAGLEEKPAPGDRSGRREERGRKRVRDTKKQAERQRGMVEPGGGGKPHLLKGNRANVHRKCSSEES